MASQPKTPPKGIITQPNKKVVKANTEVLGFQNTLLDLVEPLEELEGLTGGRKQMWLRQHRGEVIDYFNANGRVATLLRFNIHKESTLDNLFAVHALIEEDREKVKTVWGQLPGEYNTSAKGGGRRVQKGSPIPPGWYVWKRGTLYDYIRPATEVSGLKGGSKQLWLRIHQDEIEEFYYQNGEEATLLRYCLKAVTLDSILGVSRHTPFVSRFTKVDRLELSTAACRDDVQDLRGEVRTMREEFSQFQTTVAEKLLNKLIAPLIQNAITESGPGQEEIIVEHQCPPHHWRIGSDNIGRCVYCPATKDFNDLPERARKQMARNTLQRG